MLLTGHNHPFGRAAKDLGLDEKRALNWILKKEGGKVWTGFMRQDTG
jgi:hypothetical protein